MSNKVICSEICQLHSGMEEFKLETKEAIKEQWSTINFIRKMMLTTAISAAGTFATILIGVILYTRHLG